MTTPLEAYLTGIVLVAVSDRDTALSNLRAVTMTDEEGTILGVIQLIDRKDEVRASIYIQEHLKEDMHIHDDRPSSADLDAADRYQT